MVAEASGAAVAIAATQQGQVAWLPVQPGSQLSFQEPAYSGECTVRSQGQAQPGNLVLDICFAGDGV
jgi:hypothetical protein